MKNRHSVSIYREVLRLGMIFLLPVMTALVFYICFLVRSYRNDLVNSGEASLNIYMKEIDSCMEEAQNSVISLYEGNRAGEILQNSDDFFQKFRIVNEVARLCKDYLMANGDICGFILLYDGYQNSRFTFRSNLPNGMERYMRDQFQTDMIEMTPDRGWIAVAYEGTPYLRYSYSRSGVAIAVVIRLPQQEAPMRDEDWQIAYRLNGEALQNDFQRKEDPLTPYADEEAVIYNGLTVCSGDIADTDLRLFLIMENGDLIGRGKSAAFLVVILLLLFLGGIFGQRRMYQRVVLPVFKMEDTVKQISQGDTRRQMETKTGILEFDILGAEFNHMTEQIGQLRIATYEKTLQEERTRLQYLRLQLKPHFFLNCLSSLHALAMQQKTEQLEDRIITMSQYFRYLLQDDFTLRPLEDEIRFTENAVDIRRDGYQGDIQLCITVEDGLGRIPVPALIVETFVENSVKYAECKGNLKLMVSVSKMEENGEEYLMLLLTDNGVGFPEKWLLLLNEQNTQNTQYVEGHIGIMNLLCRLNILYSGRHKIHAENYDGATVEIWLPIDDWEK